MRIIKNQTVNFFIKYLAILLASVSTGFAANYDAEVFEFQQKLAKGGDAHAQYRLATMYESGRGVNKDSSLAMTWYQKSSSNNLSAATRYLKYLEIRNSAFKPEDKAWLKTVYIDAKKGDENALIILGKLHENGIGVKKSLKKSQRYLKLAFNRGNTDAEINLNRVEQKIFAIEKKLKQKNELLALNKEKEQKQKQIKNISPKKETKKKQIAKHKPNKSNNKNQISENNIELKRLETERNKIARERKELEALRKDIAEKQAVKDKPVNDKPATDRIIASNNSHKATSHTADACSGKAARFMSRCQ